jgi:small subunit ribosomal protein S17
MAEKKKTKKNEEAAEQPVRDSGPGEGAPGEPGGSPDAEAGADEKPAAEEAAEQPVAEEAAPEPVAEEAVEQAVAEEEPATEEPAPEVPAEATDEPAATEGEVAEAPAAEAPPQSEPKKKRKRLPRAQRRQRPKVAREKPAERKPITRLPKPESERGRRQERRGVVVSSAMDKTIIVKVDTIKAHARYKKVVRRSVKFHAHDEQNTANVGDIVRIVETRPLSKTKNWRLVEVVEAAK